MRDHGLIISTTDLERLQPVFDGNDTPAAELLDFELRRATIVPPHEVPPDVVTMNTDVIYEDVDNAMQRRVRVVLPHDADPKHGHISVLAPIGSALLGLRVGQSITWRVPSGTKHIRVVEIANQQR